jgi:preprotein translocase subunit SecG
LLLALVVVVVVVVLLLLLLLLLITSSSHHMATSFTVSWQRLVRRARPCLESGSAGVSV